MGLLSNMFGGWHQASGISFRHGVEVKIGGGFDHTSRYAGRVGAVMGVTGEKFVYRDGLYDSCQKCMLVDLGGMRVPVPPSDLEMVEERGKVKWD